MNNLNVNSINLESEKSSETKADKVNKADTSLKKEKEYPPGHGPLKPWEMLEHRQLFSLTGSFPLRTFLENGDIDIALNDVILVYYKISLEQLCSVMKQRIIEEKKFLLSDWNQIDSNVKVIKFSLNGI